MKLAAAVSSLLAILTLTACGASSDQYTSQVRAAGLDDAPAAGGGEATVVGTLRAFLAPELGDGSQVMLEGNVVGTSRRCRLWISHTLGAAPIPPQLYFKFTEYKSDGSVKNVTDTSVLPTKNEISGTIDGPYLAVNGETYRSFFGYFDRTLEFTRAEGKMTVRLKEKARSLIGIADARHSKCEF